MSSYRYYSTVDNMIAGGTATNMSCKYVHCPTTSNYKRAFSYPHPSINSIIKTRKALHYWTNPWLKQLHNNNMKMFWSLLIGWPRWKTRLWLAGTCAEESYNCSIPNSRICDVKPRMAAELPIPPVLSISSHWIQNPANILLLT